MFVLPTYHHKKAIEYRWFENFEISMKAQVPSLNELMLYTGPGLARAWMKRAAQPDEQARVDQYRLLLNLVKSGLDSRLRDGSFNLIDLGVGNCQKAAITLAELATDGGLGRAHLYLLDASLELLVHGTAGFEAITRNSFRSLTALHCDLNNVIDPVRELMDSKIPNLFLLLGNTLGNLNDDRHTLERLGKAIQADSELVIEVQKIKPPADADTVRIHCLDNKQFYGGPFLAAGAPFDSFDVTIDYGPVENGEQINTVRCTFNRKIEMHQVEFRDPVVVRKNGSVTVYQVKRYSPVGLGRLLHECGFNVKAIETKDETDMMIVVASPAPPDGLPRVNLSCDVLFVSSIPRGESQPAADEERKKISGVGLSVERCEGDFNEFLWKVANLNPRVVHFCMHTCEHNGETALMFKNERSDRKPITPKELANYFNVFEKTGKTVEIVVLSVCSGHSLGEALGRQVDYVITFPGAVVRDNEATTFAEEFYGHYKAFRIGEAARLASTKGQLVFGRIANFA